MRETTFFKTEVIKNDKFWFKVLEMGVDLLLIWYLIIEINVEVLITALNLIVTLLIS